MNSAPYFFTYNADEPSPVGDRSTANRPMRHTHEGVSAFLREDAEVEQAGEEMAC